MEQRCINEGMRLDGPNLHNVHELIYYANVRTNGDGIEYGQKGTE